MTAEEFDKIVEARLASIKSVLIAKAREYAPGGDRFHNFKVAAAADGVTTTRALWGMYLKHYVSVKDIVDKAKPGDLSTLPSIELLREKIGDSINYHVLLEGLVMEMVDEARSGAVRITCDGVSGK